MPFARNFHNGLASGDAHMASEEAVHYKEPKGEDDKGRTAVSKGKPISVFEGMEAVMCPKDLASFITQVCIDMCEWSRPTCDALISHIISDRLKMEHVQQIAKKYKLTQFEVVAIILWTVNITLYPTHQSTDKQLYTKLNESLVSRNQKVSHCRDNQIYIFLF